MTLILILAGIGAVAVGLMAIDILAAAVRFIRRSH
jgi:hypothetical protein